MKNPASSARSLCAVVPAAGRGSRLGTGVPKVFVPLTPSLTIWDAIHARLAPFAGRIVLVLSPHGHDFVAANRAGFPPEKFSQTELALQPEPRGMGDAIFGAADCWSGFDDLLVVWGDQCNLSAATLQACLELHAAQKKPTLTLPLVRVPEPYVEYRFDSAGRLAEIRQSREGEACAPDGLADIGMFLLSGGEPLLEEWRRYRARGEAGSKTGEINFLPFLVHLSRNASWNTARYESPDPAEALGINTPEDLALARRLLQKESSPRGESS